MFLPRIPTWGSSSSQNREGVHRKRQLALFFSPFSCFFFSLQETPTPRVLTDVFLGRNRNMCWNEGMTKRTGNLNENKEQRMFIRSKEWAWDEKKKNETKYLDSICARLPRFPSVAETNTFLFFFAERGNALGIRNKKKKFHQTPDVCTWLVIQTKANFVKTILQKGSTNS